MAADVGAVTAVELHPPPQRTREQGFGPTARGRVGRAANRLPNLDSDTLPNIQPADLASAADVDPIIVRQILADVNPRINDGDSLLRGLGFGPADLDAYEFRVSYAQTSRVIRRALRLAGSEGLALRLGAGLNPVSWGLCCVGLMASASLHDLLAFAVDFLPSTKRMLNLRWERTGDGGFEIFAEPLFEDEPEVAAFLVQNAFASLVRVARFVADPHFAPRAVEFRHEEAAAAGATAALGCEPAFGRPQDRLRVDAPDRPIATADPVVARMCRRVLTLQRPGATVRSELEEAIVRIARANPRMPPTADAFAASMNISERTLRRRLKESGASFAAILDQERRRCVMAMLRNGERSFGEVAEACGFADARSLRRAFKRWTGRTPSQARQEPGDEPMR